MKHADDPNLSDLKKLLKRLEKIDPDAQPEPTSKKAEPATGSPRKSPDALLDRPANDAAPVDPLLKFKSREEQRADNTSTDGPSDLPVIVQQSLPATVSTENDPGTFQTVIIASITAAVVSALATAGTVYWLNMEASRLTNNAPSSPPAIITSPEVVADKEVTVASSETEHAAPDRQMAASVGEDPPASRQPNTADAETTASARIGAPLTKAPASPPASVGDPASSTLAENTVSAGEISPESTAVVEKDEREVADSSVAIVESNAVAEPNTFVQPTADSASETGENKSKEIDPPRPQLAGIPESSGEIPAIDQGEAITTLDQPANLPLLSSTHESDAISNAEDAAQTPVKTNRLAAATSIPSANELIAALTTSKALAAVSRPSEQIKEAIEARQAVGAFEAADVAAIDESGALSSNDGRETMSARSQADAPVVAVYEAPQQLPSGPIAPGEGNSETTTPAVEEAESAMASWPEKPEVAAGEVVLYHPDVAPIQAGEPVALPLEVLGAPADLAGHFLIVSGLKRGTQPTAGTELMFDTWRVDIADFSDFKIYIPAGFARRLHITAELRRPDGTTRKKTSFVLRMQGTASSIASDSLEPQGLPVAVLRSVDDGEVQIDNGSLRAARLLFRRAADAGSARAAMLMAATFDPNYMAAFNTISDPASDIAEARRWYKRAAELGADEAVERSQRLPSG